MRVPELWRRGVVAPAFVVLLACLLGPVALAEEDSPADEPGAESKPEPVSPAEAKRLAERLTKAAKKRKFQDVLPVLDELALRSDPSFRKPLIKMLSHGSGEVATRAADALGAQITEDEKDAKKFGKSVWKSGWTSRANKARFIVQGRILQAVAKIEGGGPLDKVRIREVEKLWRKVTGAPKRTNAPALVSICEYVRLTKDKRLCRLLAEEIDKKEATDVNSPSNPPQEWWEERFWLWRAVMAEAVEALEVLTGQSFKSTAQARDWFRANEREFGFKW